MENLTGKDIASIIQAGAKSGVLRLEYGPLKVLYSFTAMTEAERQDHALVTPSSTESDTDTPIQNLNTDELDAEMLNYTDPAAYEALRVGANT